MLWWLDSCVGIWSDVCGGEWIAFVFFILFFSGKRSCPLSLLGRRLWVQVCGFPSGHRVLSGCVLWMGCVAVGESI